jgi:hypothetical protein
MEVDGPEVIPGAFPSFPPGSLRTEVRRARVSVSSGRRIRAGAGFCPTGRAADRGPAGIFTVQDEESRIAPTVQPSPPPPFTHPVRAAGNPRPATVTDGNSPRRL